MLQRKVKICSLQVTKNMGNFVVCAAFVEILQVIHASSTMYRHCFIIHCSLSLIHYTK